MSYVISYSVPNMYKIVSFQGNGSESEFSESDVYWRLMSDLGSIGINAEAIVS